MRFSSAVKKALEIQTTVKEWIVSDMNENYHILITKLDAFIRKYYKNLVIRGSLIFVSALLIFFLLITFIEHLAYLSKALRAILFFLFLIFNVSVIIRMIVIPGLKIFRLGRLISHEEAAHIIGRHFSDIEDRLLNVLQLKKLSDSQLYTKDLIEAGINQKINSIKPIPFKKAVNFAENRRYLKYALSPLLLLVLILFFSPQTITGPAFRILHYEKHFEKEAPFSFALVNEELSALQNSDYTLEVKVNGRQLPADVYISIGNNSFLLNKRSPSRFYYTFRNVQSDTPFSLSALDYSSGDYTLLVLPKPVILNFDVELQYPPYINKAAETISNVGDMAVPQGTMATWRFYTRDTRHILFYFNDSLFNLEPQRQNHFVHKERLLANAVYSVLTHNEHVEKADSMPFSIEVIPDAFPYIEVEEFRDSVMDKNLFFTGTVKDDYGLRRLSFNYTVLQGGNRNENSFLRRTDIPLNTLVLNQRFYHHFDIRLLTLSPGDVVEYYFEVWDNDGINGSKSSRSRTFSYRLLSESEIQERSSRNSEAMMNQFQQAMRNVLQIERSIDDLNKKILEKRSLNWEDRKNIEDLLQMNRDLQQQTEQIQEFFEQKEQWEQQYNELDNELLQKQEELNKMLESLMTEEMKALMEELERMLENLDRNKVKEMLDKMKLNTQDVGRELDRSMELLKQFEFEKKLSETIEKLEKLAEEQKQLSEESRDRNQPQQDVLDKQNMLNEAFENIQKELEDLHQKNEALERPNDFERTDEAQEQIQEQMQEGTNQLQRNNRNRAGDSQQKAGEMLQQLAEQLQEMEANMMQSNLGEDINALRRILENLLRTSFAQEDVLEDLIRTRTSDPRYNTIMQNQNKLRDDLKMIQDSLFALSKRQMQIESFVNREIADINSNMDKAIEALVDRNEAVASTRQQYIITHINNLALMLSESLQNMQMAMQMQSGNCQNPSPGQGRGEQSFRSLREMQEALNQMMQDMKDGKTPGGSQGRSLSEQLARMAAQQEAIRNHLKSLSEELKQQGMGNDRALEELQQKMEQSETEIVNKRINQQTLYRQHDILTRLLEHERAEQQRELDEQRESSEAKNQIFSNPNQFFQYKRHKESEEELLRTTPASFNIFYKNKVNEYFYNFQE